MIEQIRVAIYVHIITGAYSYHALAAAAFWALYCNSNVAASTFFSISMTASGGQKPSAWTTSRKSDRIHGKILDIKTIQVKPLATLSALANTNSIHSGNKRLSSTIYSYLAHWCVPISWAWPTFSAPGRVSELLGQGYALHEKLGMAFWHLIAYCTIRD